VTTTEPPRQLQKGGSVKRLLGFIGATIGGYAGWYAGAMVGFMTGFVFSIVGSGVGMYIAFRAAQNYE
jgi:hypothetical protein